MYNRTVSTTNSNASVGLRLLLIFRRCDKAGAAAAKSKKRERFSSVHVSQKFSESFSCHNAKTACHSFAVDNFIKEYGTQRNYSLGTTSNIFEKEFTLCPARNIIIIIIFIV